jgi:hypothetical protein
VQFVLRLPETLINVLDSSIGILEGGRPGSNSNSVKGDRSQDTVIVGVPQRHPSSSFLRDPLLAAHDVGFELLDPIASGLGRGTA